MSVGTWGVQGQESTQQRASAVLPHNPRRVQGSVDPARGAPHRGAADAHGDMVVARRPLALGDSTVLLQTYNKTG